ncbi:MAG TPA: SDR family oxidoreductase [Candidatus Dorea intestinavium]|nr:SDR family oxidoreductase [Candidatus Dorea intestinavium]
MKRLEGKIAIVTGAGKGIGRDIALAIAREGAYVYCISRTLSDLNETVDLIHKDGGKAFSFPLDLTDEAQVMDMVAEIEKLSGGIDILVNNAGGYPKEIYNNRKEQAIRLWEWSKDQWDQILKTNLNIPFLCLKYVLPVMIRQKSGDIVNISSRMGRIASQMGGYAVAKGGIITLTKTAAIQTAEYGVRVNAIAPGMVDTPGQRAYNESVGQNSAKMGDAKSVASAAIYLLCDAPQIMTGQVMDLFTVI